MGGFTEGTEIESQLSPHLYILVAEDNEPTAFVTTTFLQSSGYHSEVAKNGSEAVEKAKSGRFALVLMDVTMPAMDGWTATRHIREFERGNYRKPVPIIGVTASAFAGDKELCLSAGMDDYLSKPVDFDLLEEKLKLYLL